MRWCHPLLSSSLEGRGGVCGWIVVTLSCPLPSRERDAWSGGGVWSEPAEGRGGFKRGWGVVPIPRPLPPREGEVCGWYVVTLSCPHLLRKARYRLPTSLRASQR